MARDDFSKPTVDTLAKRVGVRCSNPSCRKLTTGPRTDSSYIVNIGVGAHISAASPDGPRYNSSLTTEQRQAPENGIWLCQNCAKLVDNDPDRYPVDILRAWKIHAEASALAEIEGRTETEPIDCSAEIELSYERERIRSERHDYKLQVTLTNRGSNLLAPSTLTLKFPLESLTAQRSNNFTSEAEAPKTSPSFASIQKVLTTKSTLVTPSWSWEFTITWITTFSGAAAISLKNL